VEEATIQKQQVELSKSSLEDNIKIEANKSYHDYLESLKKVDLLHTAVLQASENDRIMEAKYKNQLATTTDRIDAETMLYQSKINLEIAKADAVIAYYNVLKSIGTIQP
jgi:outer membrane protein TolC